MVTVFCTEPETVHPFSSLNQIRMLVFHAVLWGDWAGNTVTEYDGVL